MRKIKMTLLGLLLLVTTTVADENTPLLEKLSIESGIANSFHQAGEYLKTIEMGHNRLQGAIGAGKEMQKRHARSMIDNMLRGQNMSKKAREETTEFVMDSIDACFEDLLLKYDFPLDIPVPNLELCGVNLFEVHMEKLNDLLAFSGNWLFKGLFEKIDKFTGYNKSIKDLEDEKKKHSKTNECTLYDENTRYLNVMLAIKEYGVCFQDLSDNDKKKVSEEADKMCEEYKYLGESLNPCSIKVGKHGEPKKSLSGTINITPSKNFSLREINDKINDDALVCFSTTANNKNISDLSFAFKSAKCDENGKQKMFVSPTYRAGYFRRTTANDRRITAIAVFTRNFIKENGNYVLVDTKANHILAPISNDRNYSTLGSTTLNEIKREPFAVFGNMSLVRANPSEDNDSIVEVLTIPLGWFIDDDIKYYKNLSKYADKILQEGEIIDKIINDFFPELKAVRAESSPGVYKTSKEKGKPLYTSIPVEGKEYSINSSSSKEILLPFTIDHNNQAIDAFIALTRAILSEDAKTKTAMDGLEKSNKKLIEEAYRCEIKEASVRKGD